MVLVVVPTLNEAETISGVLEALSVDLPTDRTVRFVVADGGSTDGTVEIVGDLAERCNDLELLANPKRLQSAGIDAAVRAHAGDCDVFVRCDAHSSYPPGYVADLLAALERTGADSVVVPMDSIGKTCFQKAVAWVSDTPVGSGGSAHRAGRASGWVDHGHHAAMRVAPYLAAGGYDPTMAHNEDAELDCRLRAIGSRIWLESTIRVGYFPRKSVKALARQYFNYGKGRSRTVRRHPDSLRLRQFALPIHFAATVLMILAGLTIHPLFFIYPSAYVAVLCLSAIAIARSKKSLCGLSAMIAAMTMHFSWAAGFFAGLLTIPERRWVRTETTFERAGPQH